MIDGNFRVRLTLREGLRTHIKLSQNTSFFLGREFKKNKYYTFYGIYSWSSIYRFFFLHSIS